MPNISIAEESRLGKNGSNTQVRRLDGYIEDLATKERQHFVKRNGVYFMKMFVKRKPDKPGAVGFGRPGLIP